MYLHVRKRTRSLRRMHTRFARRDKHQPFFKSFDSRNLRGDFLIVFGRTAYHAASAELASAQTVLEAAHIRPLKQQGNPPLDPDVIKRIEKTAAVSSADALLSNIALSKMLQILDTLRAFHCFDLIVYTAKKTIAERQSLLYLLKTASSTFLRSICSGRSLSPDRSGQRCAEAPARSK